MPRPAKDEKGVVEIMINAIKHGQDRLESEIGRRGIFKMFFGIGREVSSEEAMRLTRIMLDCDPEYIPGISLVCHEPSGPPEKFIKSFELADSEGRETCCHVEWVKDRDDSEKLTSEQIRANFQEDLPQLLKNLKTAIFDLKVTQIDHAVGLAESPELIKAVVDKNIRTTSCPGSLLTTRVIDNIEMIKIDQLLDAGVQVSFDADDDICMPTLDEVFQKFRESRCRPPSTENLDRLARYQSQLIENAKIP